MPRNKTLCASNLGHGYSGGGERLHLHACHIRGDLLQCAFREGREVAAIHADVAPGVEDEEVQVDVPCRFSASVSLAWRLIVMLCE